MSALYECDNCKKQEPSRFKSSIGAKPYGWVELSTTIKPQGPYTESWNQFDLTDCLIACSDACAIRLLQSRNKPIENEVDP